MRTYCTTRANSRTVERTSLLRDGAVPACAAWRAGRSPSLQVGCAVVNCARALLPQARQVVLGESSRALPAREPVTTTRSTAPLACASVPASVPGAAFGRFVWELNG